MTIKDKNVIRWLKVLDSPEMDEYFEYIDETEVNWRTDVQLLADELSWCISNYTNSSHYWHDDLHYAKTILRKSINGTQIPLDPVTLKPKYGYSPWNIKIAKNTVNEYRRMVSRYNKLKQAGYIGRWL